MKKIFIITVALAMVAVFSMTAHALPTNEQDFVTFGVVSGETCTYGMSNNVIITYSTGAGQGYGLGCKHKSGNREFYTGSNMSQIFYIEDDDFKGTETLSVSVPGDQDTTFTASGAKAL